MCHTVLNQMKKTKQSQMKGNGYTCKERQLLSKYCLPWQLWSTQNKKMFLVKKQKKNIQNFHKGSHWSPFNLEPFSEGAQCTERKSTKLSHFYYVYPFPLKY